MKTKLFLSILSGIILNLNLSLAGPLYSSSCSIASKIKTPKNAGGYFLSQDCKTLYILPPAKGKMEITGVTTGDISRCREVSGFQKTLRTINQEIEKSIKENADIQELQDLIVKRKMILQEYLSLSENIGAFS